MKKGTGIFLSLFLIIVLLFIPNVVNANVGDEIKVEGFKYQILSEAEGDYKLKLIGYEGELDEVEIPSTVISGTNTYKVTSIAARAFWLNNEQVKKITIPSSVTEIETMAFNGSTKLEEIIVDTENVKYYSEDGVLFNNDKTKLVFYPEGKADKTWTIPNTVTTIGESSFYRCKVVEKVVIPNTVVKIEDFAFQVCEKLNDVTIPDSVVSIGVRAFDLCNSLESIVIPNSVTEIGWGAFESCEKLKSVVISNSITSIVERMFYGCTQLNNIIIPDSVTEIANNAFSYCPLNTKIYYVTNSLANMNSSYTKNYVLLNTEYFTSTLTVNDGYKLPKAITIKIGDEILESTEIYDFSTGKLSIPTKLINDNIEIIANGIKKNKVILYSNGGKFTNGDSSLIFEDWNNEEYEYDYENGENNLDKPVRDGYRFLGYFTEKTGGTRIDNIMAEAGIEEDMKFYAQWEEKSDEIDLPITEGEEQLIDNNNSNGNINIDNIDIETVNNPETSDNILIFIGMLLLSVVGVTVTNTIGKKYKTK